MTALMEAAVSHQPLVCSILVEEMGLRWNGGKTALMMAAELGFDDVCKVLIRELCL